jgi:hypothetical protein
MANFLTTLGNFFGGAATKGVTNIVDSVGDTIDRFVTTDEEKTQAALAKQELEIQLKKMEQDLKLAYMNDRQGARQMYAHDSTSQKILTIIFTIGFFALTGFLLGLLFKAIEIELSSFTSLFIGSVFGAFATIMTQIVSFYFGSSQSGENQGEKMADAFNKASANNDTSESLKS